jgi:cold shock CspA family protein
MRGTVIRFDRVRAFGLIAQRGREGYVFVHVTDVADRGRLKLGDLVEFEEEQTAKGPRARHVRVLVPAERPAPATRS